jgi:hypothetical protein
VNVLHGLNRSTHLDVHMTAVLLQEKRVVQNDPAVITDDRLLGRSRFTDRKTVSVISPAIFRVTVFVYDRSRRETLWKVLLTA